MPPMFGPFTGVKMVNCLCTGAITSAQTFRLTITHNFSFLFYLLHFDHVFGLEYVHMHVFVRRMLILVFSILDWTK